MNIIFPLPLKLKDTRILIFQQPLTGGKSNGKQTAYIAHLPQVYVIHGKGTGTLRKAVQNYLKTCSYVKSYRNGEHGEGGAGATVVEFK